MASLRVCKWYPKEAVSKTKWMESNKGVASEERISELEDRAEENKPRGWSAVL